MYQEEKWRDPLYRPQSQPATVVWINLSSCSHLMWMLAYCQPTNSIIIDYRFFVSFFLKICKNILFISSPLIVFQTKFRIYLVVDSNVLNDRWGFVCSHNSHFITDWVQWDEITIVHSFSSTWISDLFTISSWPWDCW